MKALLDQSITDSFKSGKSDEQEDLIDALDVLTRHAKSLGLPLTAHLISVAAESIRISGDEPMLPISG
ncbi:MAG: hypothetical protein WAN51_04700 [Alphaproteobacteria bacterium]